MHIQINKTSVTIGQALGPLPKKRNKVEKAEKKKELINDKGKERRKKKLKGSKNKIERKRKKKEREEKIERGRLPNERLFMQGHAHVRTRM